MLLRKLSIKIRSSIHNALFSPARAAGKNTQWDARTVVLGLSRQKEREGREDGNPNDIGL